MRAIPLVLALVAGGLVLTVGAGPAAACTCVDRTPAEQLAGADAVFVATGEAGPREVEGDHQVVFTLEVEVVHKGEVEAVAEVRTGTGGGDCGIDLTGRHLVFAHRADDGMLTTGTCSGTERLPAGEEATGVGPGRAPDPPPTVSGPPIGGPDGDVEDEDPSPGELLVGVVAVVALVGGVAAALLVRRRRSAASRAG